jgi:hypothetical protein
MSETWIVLGSNSMHQVQAFGSMKLGAPFKSEEAAETAKRLMERERPTLDWLVLPINPLPVRESE